MLIDDLVSEMPNLPAAALPASTRDDFIDLVEESPIDDYGRVEFYIYLLYAGPVDFLLLSIVSTYPLRFVIVELSVSMVS